MVEKKCNKCGLIKDINNFYFRNTNKMIYHVQCKSCMDTVNKLYYVKNKEEITAKVRIYNKQYYRDNINKEKLRKNAWKKNNPEKIKLGNIKWREANPDKVKKWNHNWYINNTDKAKLAVKRWQKNNPERITLLQNNGSRKRRKNPVIRMINNLSTLIRQSLKGNKQGRHWEDIVGYTLIELKQHLENQFKDGMSWENYGRNGWEIDHIIPQSLWQFENYTDREFKQCWSLCNLQPLWIYDNRSKGKKMLETADKV